MKNLYFDSGGDLAERVSRPGFELNEGKCRNYIQQICRGLAYVHKQDIVHLDLKPFNLVFATVEEDSILKITDFTFAKRLTAYDNPNIATKSTKISAMNGTVEFLAPEMIECSYATFATDCWSVGIIAYMLVTGGRSPFYGGHRFRTIGKILSCQYDLHGPEFNYISREAKDFIQQLLQSQQTHRMNINQCLKHDWLEGEDVPGETMHTLEVIPSLEVKDSNLHAPSVLTLLIYEFPLHESKIYLSSLTFNLTLAGFCGRCAAVPDLPF